MMCVCAVFIGIDDNACCGTHVSNLSDIQAIKLLHTEKKRGSTLVYYLAGNRVFRYMNQAVDTEQKLTRLLRHVSSSGDSILPFSTAYINVYNQSHTQCGP